MTKSRWTHGTRRPSVDDMTAQRTALVTGANQGIGYALAEGLAARWGPEDLVLLTGRNPARVAEAAARGRAATAAAAPPRGRGEARRPAAAPATPAGVEGRQLDVTDAGAVARMAAALAEDGGIDVVVSNATARITPDRPQEEQADEFIDVANGGTHAM